MLETPPAALRPFVETVANVTAWFDWDAVGAIATGCALWFAVLQLSRAKALERTRALGVQIAIIQAAEPLRAAVREAGKAHMKGPGLTPEALERRVRERALHLRQVLERFSVSELADAGIASAASSLLLAIASVKSEPYISSVAMHPRPVVSAAAIEAPLRFIDEQHEALRLGLLGMAIVRMGRGLERALQSLADQVKQRAVARAAWVERELAEIANERALLEALRREVEAKWERLSSRDAGEGSGGSPKV